MRPSARIQSAIEILDQVIDAARNQGAPADRILANWFKAHRFAGSKDKRAIRELVYDVIRFCGPVPASGRSAMLALATESEDHAWVLELFDGSQYGPDEPAEGEAVAPTGFAPPWLEERMVACDLDAEDAMALLDRAPLDLRVNTLKLARSAVELPEASEELPAASGLRVPNGSKVDQWDAYMLGQVEVQDGGSQLACQAVGAQPGETVVDLCAGAGGKTLALAAAMHNTGTLIAADTDRRRLSQLGPRAQRAGASNITEVLLDPGRELDALADYAAKADRVLIDAPCSGTGTWRRNPESRWRLTARELERLVELQARLLGIAAQLIKPGGQLTYITCSLLDEEGAGQVERFLGANPGWQAAPPVLPLGRARGNGVRLTPFHDGTDGFFIACLGKPW